MPQLLLLYLCIWMTLLSLGLMTLTLWHLFKLWVSIFLLRILAHYIFFLGIEVARTDSGLFLSRHNYIHDLLHCTNMHQSKSISTPMLLSDKLSAIIGCTFDDLHWYCSVVVSHPYFAFTIPNISFDVNCVCQYMHNPHLPH